MPPLRGWFLQLRSSAANKARLVQRLISAHKGCGDLSSACVSWAEKRSPVVRLLAVTANRCPPDGPRRLPVRPDLERNAADAIALAMTSSVQPLSLQTRGENYPGYNPKLLIANCSTERNHATIGPNFLRKRHLCRLRTWGRDLPGFASRTAKQLRGNEHYARHLVDVKYLSQHLVYNFTPPAGESKE